jgi:hypothetical protein
MKKIKKLIDISKLGYAAVGLFCIVMVLQLLLAAGILPVHMAWGGRNTELTPSLRLSSLIAIIILCYFAYMVARRAGIMGTTPPSLLIRILSWLVSAYLVFNTVMNFLSPSKLEQWVFGPITLALVVLTVSINLMDYPDQDK